MWRSQIYSTCFLNRFEMARTTTCQGFRRSFFIECPEFISLEFSSLFPSISVDQFGVVRFASPQEWLIFRTITGTHQYLNPHINLHRSLFPSTPSSDNNVSARRPSPDRCSHPMAQPSMTFS